MKIVRAHEFGGPERLVVEACSAPQAGAGQVRIAVKAASVNPADWKLLSGKSPVLPALPLTPGGDVAGVIDQVGNGVTGWHAGDEVFALIGLTGGYAEWVVVDVGALAKKPVSLDFASAASLPLVALTAWQGFLADERDLAGLHVLAHNGAGGVGTVAVQIAKAKGARVTATASAANAEFVRGLGADKVVDFRMTPVSGASKDVDVLLDLVGNPQAMDLWSLIKPGGSVIRVAGGADAPQLAEAGGLRVCKVRVKPNGSQLAQIASLIDRGALRAEVAKCFPLASAADAQLLSMTGHVRGKVVLTMN